MNTRKPLMIAGLIAAISMGSVGIASASQHGSHGASVSNNGHSVSTSTPSVAPVDPDIAVLAKLVAAGTITQAQSTIILAALQAAHPQVGPGNGGPGDMGRGHGKGGPGVNMGEDLNVITTTLGITAAQLQTGLAAGQSLATIAGTKTPALITALVAAETTEINARVTAGKLTQAQATTLISGLTAAVTTAVNATPFKGGMGHGMGMPGAPLTPPSN